MKVHKNQASVAPAIKTLSILLTVILLAVVSPADSFCPKASDIKPCTCDDEGLRCSDAAFSDDGLTKVFKASAERKAIRNIWIFQTSITALRKRAFGDYIIQHLYLDLNKLTKIESGAFGDATWKLISLSLTRNLLTSFPFKDFEQMIKLKQFGLGYNKLTAIPADAFEHSKSLEHLDLSNNAISRIEPHTFANLHEAKRIDLSNNKIDRLRSHSLLVKSSYRTLSINLMYNNIQFISAEAFGDHHPAILDLSGNKLTYLNEATFLPLLLNSTVIDVADNGFRCTGCDAYRWIVELKDKAVLSQLLNFACTDDTKIEDLTLDSIGCPKNVSSRSSSH